MSSPVATVFAYVGGYTAESDGTAQGLHSYGIDLSGIYGVRAQELSPISLPSPSYLLAHPRLPILYAVSESGESSVSTIRLAPDGTPSLVDSVPTSGSGACHLAVDATGSFVIVAHFSEPTVTSHRIGHDGRLSKPIGRFSFSGSGLDRVRQTQSHIHQVVCTEGFVNAVDTGTDQIHRLRLDVEGSFSLADEPLRLPTGSGPRHIAVRGNQMVIGCELSGDLWLAQHERGRWELGYQILSSTAGVPAHPGALRIDGNTVFVTNRGPESFATFRLDPGSDRLVFRGEVSTGGSWPRDLVTTDQHVWVANQASNSIAVYRRPPVNAPADAPWDLDFELPVPSPACLVLRERSPDGV